MPTNNPIYNPDISHDLSLVPEGEQVLTYENTDDLDIASPNIGAQEDVLYEHYAVVADAGQEPLRADKFLVDRMPRTSRHRIQLAAEAGSIFANGKRIKSNYKVKPGDRITLQFTRPRYEYEIVAENIPLDVVYEDEDLMVVNKPAGLVVHPGNGNYRGTLVNALAHYLRDTPGYDPEDPRLGLVHRIDKDTSGLLVIAKQPEAKTSLSRQFFEKTSQRTYRALVWGRFDEQEGTIEGNIGRDTRDRIQMSVYPPDSLQGKPAITHYSVLETLAYVSVIECRLETGRTHQIRAHMRHIGHPLFADQRYGGDSILRGSNTQRYKQFVSNCFDTCPRQALHAKTLGFVHPRTGKKMLFDSDIPEDMTNLIDKWRHYVASLTQI